MKIIQTIASTRLDYGGTSRSIPALCNALTELGIDNEFVTTTPSNGPRFCNLPNDRNRTHLVCERSLAKQLSFGSPFVELLRDRVRGCSDRVIVHDHAIWLANNHFVARYCRKKSITRIVSPRGMLGQWAMAHSKWKKRLAWHLFQKRDLQSATAFHATSEQEALEIRSHGLVQPIAIVPNGVEIPGELPIRSKNESKQFLFMSRLHPKKGLENLIQAWSDSGVDASGWKLLIVGPGADSYRAHVHMLINRLKAQDSIAIQQEISDDEKWQYYVDSDVFILPSFNENFGIVIAEALAAGVPTIASTKTPWKEIESHGFGWWVSNDIPTLTATIRTAVSTTVEERRLMGGKASEWIRANYSWKAAAQQLVHFYHSIEAAIPTVSR